MIENSMTLKERKKILKHLQGKTTTFTQLHVLKDAIEAHEKLERIEQIVDSWDCATVLAENDWKYIKKIKKVLEQE